MRLEQALPTIRPLLRHATFTLLSHRLRSFVSTIGVACGVASFMLLMSLGEGARRETLEQLEGLGLRNLVIRAASLNPEQREAAQRQGSRGLTAGDAARIAAALPSVGGIAILKELKVTVHSERGELSPQVLSVTPELASAQSMIVSGGRFIAASDVSSRARVCVLGSALASQLGNEGRLGSELRLEGDLCQVVGILKPTGSRKHGAVSSRDYDHALLLPFSGADDASELVASVKKGEDVPGAAAALRRVMGLLHKGASDYQLIVPEELRRQAEASRATFDFLLGALGLICLLMGGIGIMNVMLASVAERTYEVGLRRALGASREAVLIQFVLEALMLTLAGEALGIAAGLSGLLLISFFASWAACVTVWSLALPLLIATVLGVGFGFYPALRASRLDPIEALRY